MEEEEIQLFAGTMCVQTFVEKKSPKRTPENVDMTLVERTGSTRCFSFCMVQINLCDFGTFTIFAASCLVLRVHPLVVCKGDIMFQT